MPTQALDATITALLERLSDRLDAAGLNRTRGGFSRGVHWAERSGRAPDGLSWLELRVHHWPNERKVSAGLIEYHSLARGGRTADHGKFTVYYEAGDPDAPTFIAGTLEPVVAEWLAR